MAKQYKRLLVERKGVTVEKEPQVLRISLANDSVYTPENHKQSEEIGYVLVESGTILSMLEQEIEAFKAEQFAGMSYPEKFEALLKEFGAEKISDLSDEKKKEFFNTLDEIHVSKEEMPTEINPVESNITVSESSVRIEIPGVSSISEKLTREEEIILGEALRSIHGLLSGKSLREEESVEVPADAEAEVKVEGDKLVIELPIESPVDEVDEETAAAISEAVSVAKLALTEGIGKALGGIIDYGFNNLIKKPIGGAIKLAGKHPVLAAAVLGGLGLAGGAEIAQNWPTWQPVIQSALDGAASSGGDAVSSVRDAIVDFATQNPTLAAGIGGAIGGPLISGTGVLATTGVKAFKDKKAKDLSRREREIMLSKIKLNPSAYSGATEEERISSFIRQEKEAKSKQVDNERKVKEEQGETLAKRRAKLVSKLNPEELADFEKAEKDGNSPEDFDSMLKMTPEQKLRFKIGGKKGTSAVEFLKTEKQNAEKNAKAEAEKLAASSAAVISAEQGKQVEADKKPKLTKDELQKIEDEQEAKVAEVLSKK